MALLTSKINWSNFNFTAWKNHVPNEMLRPIKDILVQLVRNSVSHGIEPVDQRGDKPQQGELLIKIIASHDELRLSVRDDGNGIDLDKIRHRIVDMGKASRRSFTLAFFQAAENDF